ncbi:MAG: hypothetical protein LBD68_01300 [Zoogloeaceae bacterium]|jgi:chromosome segregation ATPase|nr:hypothetical protein [Zoogloeaceae bacterium]
MSFSGMGGSNDGIDPVSGMPRNYAAYRLIAQPEINRAHDEAQKQAQGQINNLHSEWQFEKAEADHWHTEALRLSDVAQKNYDLAMTVQKVANSALIEKNKEAAHWYNESMRLSDLCKSEKARADQNYAECERLAELANKNFAAYEEAVSAWESAKDQANTNYDECMKLIELANKNHYECEAEKARADAAESNLAEIQEYVKKLEQDARDLLRDKEEYKSAFTSGAAYLQACINVLRLDSASPEIKAAILRQGRQGTESGDDPETPAPVEGFAGKAKSLADKFSGWRKQIEAAGGQGQSARPAAAAEEHSIIEEKS